jgi:hypothetical protein
LYEVLSIQSAKRLLKGESAEKRYRELEKNLRPGSPRRILGESRESYRRFHREECPRYKTVL